MAMLQKYFELKKEDAGGAQNVSTTLPEGTGTLLVSPVPATIAPAAATGGSAPVQQPSGAAETH